MDTYQRSLQSRSWPRVDSLFRLLFIFDHSKMRSRSLLLPTSDYDKIAITEDRIVVWSTWCQDFTPLSIWDSTWKTLQHFRCPRTYKDFAVLRHADQVILMSGISSLRSSKSVIVRDSDSDGKLDASLEMPCPRHVYLGTYEAANEFSRPLSSESSPSTTFANYRFSSAGGRITSANFHYHPTTRSLTTRIRRSPFPRTSEEVRKDLQPCQLHGFTIHTQNVFSIAWEKSSIIKKTEWHDRGPRRENYHEVEHDFYDWRGELLLTHGTSELSSINCAIYEHDKNWEWQRYAKLWKCCGVERFLVKLFDNRFEVYCFDKDFCMPRTDKAYRAERERRAAARSKKRQRQARKL
jgi:hypothetical protein